MKVFISQPMKDKTDAEIRSTRAKAIQAVINSSKEPVEVIDSFFSGVPAEVKPMWYLGKSIQLLASADVVYFAKGWNDARGCRIEHLCAEEYGVKIIEEGNDSEIPENTANEIRNKYRSKRG